MKHISKVLLTVSDPYRNQGSIFQACPSEVGGRYTLKVKVPGQGPNCYSFLSFTAVDVISLQITFSNGITTIKGMVDYPREKAWGHVRRVLQRKAYTDALLSEDQVGQPLSWGNEEPGLGQKEYWFIRGSRVYSQEAAAIVDKHFDVCNATFICPDSWLDKMLQKAYTSPTLEEKRKSTDE